MQAEKQVKKAAPSTTTIKKAPQKAKQAVRCVCGNIRTMRSHQWLAERVGAVPLLLLLQVAYPLVILAGQAG